MTDLMRFVEGYPIMESGLTFMRVVSLSLIRLRVRLSSCGPAALKQRRLLLDLPQ